MRHRNRVVVPAIPIFDQTTTCASAQRIENRLELLGGNRGGNRPPAIPVSKQNQHVRARCQTLTPRDLFETNFHRALVAASFFADPPPQIDRLKARSALAAAIRQDGKDRVVVAAPRGNPQRSSLRTAEQGSRGGHAFSRAA